MESTQLGNERVPQIRVGRDAVNEHRWGAAARVDIAHIRRWCPHAVAVVVKPWQEHRRLQERIVGRTGRYHSLKPTIGLETTKPTVGLSR